MANTAYDFETITVTTSAGGGDTSKIQPSGGADPAREMRIWVRAGGPINYRYDGTAPTSTVGLGPISTTDDFPIIINGTTNILNFSAIRDSSAGGNATLAVTYLR